MAADGIDMSDLTRLLGDVYGGKDDEEVDDRVTGPTLPEWADEKTLDEAFSHWVPGPPADAPASERTMLTELASSHSASAAPSPDETPLAAPAPAPAALEVLPASVPTPWAAQPGAADWGRSQDDILPARSQGRRRR